MKQALRIFFVSGEGDYLTPNGGAWYLDLNLEMTKLFIEGEDVIINSVIPGKPQIMIFIVPCAKEIYKGFEYQAIGVSYNNTDIENALQINAFDRHLILIFNQSVDKKSAQSPYMQAFA